MLSWAAKERETSGSCGWPLKQLYRHISGSADVICPIFEGRDPAYSRMRRSERELKPSGERLKE